MTNEELAALKERVNRAEEILGRIDLLKRRKSALDRFDQVQFHQHGYGTMYSIKDPDLIDDVKQTISKSTETEIAFLETEFAQL